ncbi:MAG: NAD(P)H-dependent oxidoreductase [Acidimicrobiales bacterium]|nr:NAD(P)H-dependent oxidoreductase [Acidimicrobiales bacterium]
MSVDATSSTPAAPLRLAVLIGSNREGRFAPTVAGWFVAQASARADLELDVVDLADLALPWAYPAGPNPEVAALQGRLGEADALVIVTPEYNHSFPGPLKHALDLAGRSLAGKPVGFVAYGGMSGGLRAVEALRVVVAELHAMSVRDTVSFHSAWDRFDDAGVPHDEAGAAGAAEVLLDQLQWWGQALRAARAARPYGS